MTDQYFNPNMGSINQYTETNQSHQIPSPLNFHVSLMGYEYDHQLHDNLFPHHLFETSETYHPGLVIQEDNSTITPSFTEPVIFSDHSDRKRKSMEENSCANSSSQGSDTRRRKSGGRGKKVKVEVEKKSTDHVVHVRAKRGQATDSHSLAERVRRGKINERLRCLEDIVPGCYKTMGMAGMLDETINYVQSLQNQVEFLSMKLAAASTFYDFNNLDTNAIQTMQREKAFEALKIQNLETSGLPAQFALEDLNLSYFPQLPHNR